MRIVRDHCASYGSAQPMWSTHLIALLGLPNIIAGRAIVKELIQDAVSADSLSAEIERLLSDQPYRAECLAGLKQVKAQLGEGGGSKNMADLAMEMLRRPG